MFNTNSMPSLSDIAAVTNNGNEFGNGWWALIILLALFGGWGNNGIGFGRSNGGVSDNYVLASDFSNIERKIDGVNNGLCDGFYAMNTGMLNGFNNTNVAMMQGFNGVTAGQTALSTQLAQCCCDNRAAVADMKYTMATDTCATNTNIANTTRDIIDSQRDGTREILKAIYAQNDSAKEAKIAELNAKIQELTLAASQQAQNNYIISQLRQSYGFNSQCCPYAN